MVQCTSNIQKWNCWKSGKTTNCFDILCVEVTRANFFPLKHECCKI